MKRILAKILSIFAVLLLVLSMTTANVFATNTSQDGLAVYTMTDKDSYKEGEKATVFIAVENTNGYDMENVNVTISLPEELSLSETQDFNIPLLKADEIKEYKITIEKNSDEITITPDNPTTDNNNTETDLTNNIDNAVSKVDTSDNYVIIGFVILLGLSLTVILIVKMGEKCKKVLIIALISTMAVSLFNIGNVNAKNTSIEQKEISTIQNIIYDNNTYPLNVKVAYSKENGEIVDNGEITREEWITKLVDIMGYTAEFETYSFHDFDKASNPDKIETAIQYGLVELTPNADNMVLFSPREYATREFVAYSTIKALGFYTCNTSVVCNDNDILMYPEADKLMVHYGMFKLVNNNFNPYQFVSNKEVEIIVDKIKEINDSTSINPDAENKIEYTENTKQYTLDFNLDEEQKIITSNDNQLSNVKNGEIIILNNPNNIEESIAIQVNKIENINGEYTIHYDVASANQAINNIQVEGVVGNQNAIFIPEEDITIENTSKVKSKTKLTKIPFNQSITAGFEIEGKNKTSFLSGKVSMELKEMRFKFDFGRWWGFIPKLDNAQFEFLLQSKASIEIKSTNDDDKTLIWKEKEDVKKKLGKIVVPTSFGVYGTVNVYVITSISGTVTLSVEADANLGLQYKSGNFRNIGYLNTKTNNLNINAETKFGLQPEISLKTVGIELLSANTEAGLAANAGISNIKAEPFEYCVDANLYAYWTLGAQFGPDFINIKFDTDIFNEKKSPFKRNMHFEETGYVPECTRDRNNIKGLVKDAKSPHNPIANAKVQIYNEANNIMGELYTSEAGTFTSQNLKSGNYTIIVSATGYETYSDTVELMSGKEITLEILLTKSNDDEGNGDEEETNKSQFTPEIEKTYRIECIKDKKLYTSYEENSISEIYYENLGNSGSILESKGLKDTMSYRSMQKGDFIDIKVNTGKLNLYALKNEDTLTGEHDNFNNYFKVTELNHDPLKKIYLSSGDSVSLDYQYIGNRFTNIRYHFSGNNLSGSRTETDYYWNSRFGMEIEEVEKTLNSTENYWTSLDEGCIHKYTINSGTAILYMWYEDANKLVIK